MKRSLKYTIFAVAIILAISWFFLQTKKDSNLSKQPVELIQKSNVQDTSDKKEQYPFKGFSRFLVFPPSFIFYDAIKAELEKFGTVTQAPILIETKEGLEFQSYDTDATIKIELKEVVSIEEKVLPITMVSLSMQAPVIIQKNQEHYIPYLWSKSCFFEGTMQDLSSQKSFIQSLNRLLELFIEEEKPTQPENFSFFLVSPS